MKNSLGYRFVDLVCEIVACGARFQESRSKASHDSKNGEFSLYYKSYISMNINEQI
jgi:hypothetical protein